ncbi:MAG: FadR family transcriptional regulator [Anaerolineaceae bacterium]|nr:FadR family transcriptional regulator [Anaerolineaceae bacterium]
MKDILQIRMALEPMTVRLAIRRSSQEDLARLREIHECSKIAAIEKDSARLAECDEDFHSYITQCSKNTLLIEINQNISAVLKDFRGKTFMLNENIENFIPAHAKILEAFENRAPIAGEEYMRLHLAKVSQDLEKSKEVKKEKHEPK